MPILGVQGVLLAGGSQTRLQPLGLAIPKALIRVGDIRVGDVAFDQLSRAANDVSIFGGRIAETMDHAWSARGGRCLADPQLGTGTAVMTAATASRQPVLLVANADTLNDLDLVPVVAAHLRNPQDALIVLTRRLQNVQNAG
ncbi:MAG: sugar phosphate nucleotidyltransferase, partial [Gammaproteobacteria bacterium]